MDLHAFGYSGYFTSYGGDEGTTVSRSILADSEFVKPTGADRWICLWKVPITHCF